MMLKKIQEIVQQLSSKIEKTKPLTPPFRRLTCSQGEDLVFLVLLEDLGDLLGCDPGTRMDGPVVLVVVDVLVSPSSVVTEFCDGVSTESDREFVEPQSFLSQTSARWIGRFRKER